MCNSQVVRLFITAEQGLLLPYSRMQDPRERSPANVTYFKHTDNTGTPPPATFQRAFILEMFQKQIKGSPSRGALIFPGFSTVPGNSNVSLKSWNLVVCL